MNISEKNIQEIRFQKKHFDALIKVVVLKEETSMTVYRINLLKPFNAHITLALNDDEQNLSISFNRSFASRFKIKKAFKFPYLDENHQDHSILEDHFLHLFELMYLAYYQKFKNRNPVYKGDNIVIKKDKAYIDLIPEGLYPGLLVRFIVDKTTGDIEMKSWDQYQKTKVGKYLEHKTRRWVSHGKIFNIKEYDIFPKIFDPKTQQDYDLTEDIVDECYPIFFEYGNDLLHEPIATDENTKSEPIKWIKGSEEELIQKLQLFFYSNDHYLSESIWPLSIIIGYKHFNSQDIEIILESSHVTEDLKKFIKKIESDFYYEGYRFINNHTNATRKFGHSKLPQIIKFELQKPNPHQLLDARIKIKGL